MHRPSTPEPRQGSPSLHTQMHTNTHTTTSTRTAWQMRGAAVAGVPAPLSATCLTTCRALRRRSDTTLLDVMSDITACEKQCQSARGKSTHTHTRKKNTIQGRWSLDGTRRTDEKHANGNDERKSNRTSERRQRRMTQYAWGGEEAGIGLLKASQTTRWSAFCSATKTYSS